jgi:hypothetical protein
MGPARLSLTAGGKIKWQETDKLVVSNADDSKTARAGIYLLPDQCSLVQPSCTHIQYLDQNSPHLVWYNRFVAMKPQDLLAEFDGPTKTKIATVDITSIAATGKTDNFLAWMVCNFYAYIYKKTVENFDKDFKFITMSESPALVQLHVSQEAMKEVFLECVYRSGRMRIMPTQQELGVAVRICGQTEEELLAAATTEREEGNRDEYTDLQEKVIINATVNVEYSQFLQPEHIFRRTQNGSCTYVPLKSSSSSGVSGHMCDYVIESED